MESLSGFWSGMKSDLELLLPFLDRIWLTSSLTMLTFTVHFALDSLCFYFAMCCSHASIKL